ncbi:APH domain protein [Rhizoctonia solani AG-3 Rhs1AP]|uniref:APH domain protein n=2 Tax=Rhizoctonia solani AG-3 TaxID=1086053 RepID=A0A074RL31_9AGAM|nr:APH domain protein [Rhizoctonia solani AG-3 Rhs1AP]KEP47776.1 APH domain protein [Rhizoctonia solani 123E]
MDHSVENELRGAIFCDPSFVNHFLHIEKRHRPLLENRLAGLPKARTMLDDSLTAEHTLYGPIVDFLGLIKNAVDTVRVAHNLGSLGTNFCDSHRAIIPGSDHNTRLLKPDLVLFEDHDPGRRSWETLMMAIEVKAKATYLKVGMKQLARYAHTVFAHQIHRRHMYGMVICKWSATFVRFDRSGIVHSEPIDMLDNPKEFRTAFAGLMMLDRNWFGYDTAFTTEYTPGGQLEFYVDLPTAAFLSDDTGRDTQSVATLGGNLALQSSGIRQLPTRKFKVIERLCHRQSIRGPGTIILRLRGVRKSVAPPNSGNPSTGRITRSRTRLQQLRSDELEWEEIPGGREYVLKLMWREPDDRQEGELLKCLEGEYGVLQCQWYSDILQWGADCHEPGATSCDVCCDMTPAQEVRRVKNLGDLDVQAAEEEEGIEPQHVEVEADCCAGELHTHRTARIYSWTLFLTVGRPLRTAESPRQFLEAVLDAVLGYWQTFNRGIIHRDISDGNVLIANPGQGYKLRKWGLQQASDVQDAGAQNHPLAESRRLAQEAIMKLGRDPRGFLSDFDLATTHSGMESETFSHVFAQQEDSYPCASNTERSLDAEPPAKRPRLGDSVSCPALTTSAGALRDEECLKGCSFAVSVPRKKTSQLMDFRTGTPAFMSVRVLQVKVGATYEHHFMDDLQSFFWLILWCLAEHTDPISDKNGTMNLRTEGALTVLQKLDRVDSDYITMADSKIGLLVSCITTEDNAVFSMKRNLQSFQNSWATNPAIVDLVINLGAHFYKIAFGRKSFSSSSPAVQFPIIVGIISEALKRL